MYEEELYMISLTSLQDAENGSLFHMDCSLLSSVRYCCESPDTVCLIFPEKPADLPVRVFLMPDGKQYAASGTKQTAVNPVQKLPPKNRQL